MTARLLILVLLAAGLAVAAASKFSKAPASEADIEAIPGDEDLPPGYDADVKAARAMSKPLRDYDLPGSEPVVAPEFDIQVSVDRSSQKNRLSLWITEEHGYYVETLKLLVWYKTEPDTVFEDSDLYFEHYMDKYVQAGEPLHECFEVVPAELRHVGGSIGTSENWGARVVEYGRAREGNPETLAPERQQCE